MRLSIRRMLAGVLMGVLICNTTAGAISDDTCMDREDFIKYSGNMNAEMMENIPAAASVVVPLSEDADENQAFSISITKTDAELYAATGEIQLENGYDQFSVIGQLYEYTLSDSSIAYIGTLFGETKNQKQDLYLTIHSIPEEDEMFVLANATVKNSDDEIEDNKVYAFGELYDKMNEFVPLYAADLKADADSEFVEQINGDDASTRATVSDYNSKFVKTKISSYGNSTSGYYDLIALSVFAPNAFKANGTHYMYAKVNSNNANAKGYARTYLTIGTITDLSVVNGTVTMTAEKKEIGFTSQDPETKTYNVIIPIPVPSGNTVKVKTFSLPICKIEAEMKAVGNYNTNNLKNCAYWWFDGNNNISWSSSVDPKDTEKAYGVQGFLTNFNNLTYDTTANIEFAGTLKYSYISQYGTTQYSGTFGTSASYDHTVTLAKAS